MTIWAKPRYPTHRMESVSEDYPAIGPGWTEVTDEQLKAAELAAASCGVTLDAVSSPSGLPEEVANRAAGSTGQPEPVVPAEPTKNASTEVWAAYAQARGLSIPDGASRSEIQALVEAADNPNPEA